MKKNFVLIAMAVLALGLTACKEKAKTETTETSEVGGTTTEATTSTETTVKDDGATTTETKTEKTVDPAGLGNKETTESSTTTESTAPVVETPVHEEAK